MLDRQLKIIASLFEPKELGDVALDASIISHYADHPADLVLELLALYSGLRSRGSEEILLDVMMNGDESRVFQSIRPDFPFDFQVLQRSCETASKSNLDAFATELRVLCIWAEVADIWKTESNSGANLVSGGDDTQVRIQSRDRSGGEPSQQDIDRCMTIIRTSVEKNGSIPNVTAIYGQAQGCRARMLKAAKQAICEWKSSQ